MFSVLFAVWDNTLCIDALMTAVCPGVCCFCAPAVSACTALAGSFIWITGWSVWTDTLLQRQPASPHNSLSLGELLVQKAEQGVTVSGQAHTTASGSTGAVRACCMPMQWCRTRRHSPFRCVTLHPAKYGVYLYFYGW